MAKLGSVKLVEVEGGEISEIEYDGVSYKKVDEDEGVALGDIVQSPGALDAAEGEFYKVGVEDAYGDPAIIDDVDAKRSALNGFDVFRKEVEPKKVKRPAKVGEKIVITHAAPLGRQEYVLGDILVVKESDVICEGDIHAEGINGFIDYEEYHVIDDGTSSEEYREIGGNPKVGDFVKFDDDPRSYLTSGKYYEVVRIDSWGDPHILDDDGDGFDLCAEDIRVFEKVEEKAGAEDFEEGDRVKLISGGGKHPLNDYENGEIYEVTKLDVGMNGRVRITGGGQPNGYALPSQLEKVKADEKESERDSIVGKYVVFSDTDGADLTEGKAYEVTYEGDDGYFKIADDDGFAQHVMKNQADSRFTYEILDEKPAEKLQVGDRVKLTIAEGEEPKYKWGRVSNGDIGTIVDFDSDGDVRVDFLEQKRWMALPEELVVIPKEEGDKFEVGDFAKVIGETYHSDIKEGQFVKITQEIDEDGDYQITLIDGSDYDYAKPSSLEKIENKSDLIFIANGREPGEYKKGDIARVIKSPLALPVGTIFEVSDVHEGDVYDSSPQRFVYMTPKKQLEPIAFVEKRADKID